MSHHSPRHFQIADDNRILLTEVGSGLHGVTISGTDDHDEMGICIPPPEAVIGLEQFEQYQDRWHADGSRIPDGERSHAGDTDHVTYALNKWARLAAKGNPTVLMPLFAPNQSVFHFTDEGLALRDNKHLFLTKEAGRRFRGYLIAQKERMLGLRGRKHTNRPELVERYGFDTKCAYHALRLGMQGNDLMDHGVVVLPMEDSDASYLRDVRQGLYTLEEVIAEIEYYAWRLGKATDNSYLPDEPDYDALNDWLIGLHYGHWKSKGIL